MRMIRIHNIALQCKRLTIHGRRAFWHRAHAMRCPFHRRGRELATGLLLAVLLLRAYVPVGFMPASGTPFALEVCPVGMHGAVHAHHAPHPASPSHTDDESCLFGSAPAAAPVAHVIAFEPPARLSLQSPLAFSSAGPGIQLPRAHRARAPPRIA